MWSYKYNVTSMQGLMILLFCWKKGGGAHNECQKGGGVTEIKKSIEKKSVVKTGHRKFH